MFVLAKCHRSAMPQRVPAPAPAPGLHHDYGLITTSLVLSGVQVADVRRGYLGGTPAPAPASPGAGAGAGIAS